MEIKLTHQESENYFHSALCNGLNYIQGHGIYVDWNKQQYEKASKILKEKIANKEEMPHTMTKFVSNNEYTVCHEDVLMQILHSGGFLKLVDEEGDGDQNSAIQLKDVHERVQLTDIDHLSDMINETDDAVTADVIIQTVFLKEIVFG